MEIGEERVLSGCSGGGALLLLLNERVCESGPWRGGVDRRDHPRGVSGVTGEYDGEYGVPPIARWGDLVGVNGLEKEGVTGPGETLFPLLPLPGVFVVLVVCCNTSGLGFVLRGERLGVRTSKSSQSELETSEESVLEDWRKCSWQAVHSPWLCGQGSGHM